MRSKRQTKVRAKNHLQKWKKKGSNRLPRNKDSAQAVNAQDTLMIGLRGIVELVEEPLVVVSIEEKVGASKLVCATSLAQKLLCAAESGAADDSSIHHFLNHCRRLVSGGKDFVFWKSSRGMTYRLVLKQNGSPANPLLWIRFLPEKEIAAKDDSIETRAEVTGLTPSEIKVFVLMAGGLANKEIGRELKTSVHTVRAHLRNIFKTLNVSSRVEALNAVRMPT